MLRTLLVSISLVITSLNTSGQTRFVGLQAGLNISNLIPFSNISRTTYPLLGFAGGLKYEIQFSKKHSFGVDLLYNQQGYAFDDFIYERYGYTEKVKRTYDYLSLPIKYGYIFGDKVKFIPKIGIQPSLLLRALESGPEYNELTRRYVTGYTDIKDEPENFNIGGVIEFEIGVPYKKFEYFAIFSNRFHFTNPSGFVDLSLSLGIKYKIRHE